MVASYAAMASIFLPIGLFLKGAFSVDAPIGMIGVLGVTVCLATMIMGAFKTQQA
ncbi:MAG: hypothetical protein HRT72_01855 [Flavobacteriales bacterium]|nr:hypothetical protein [Flavobacteriales bacterium]